METPAQTCFQWISVSLFIDCTCLDSASNTNKPFLCKISVGLLFVQIVNLWFKHLITTLFFFSYVVWNAWVFTVFSCLVIHFNFLNLFAISFLLGLHTPVTSCGNAKYSRELPQDRKFYGHSVGAQPTGLFPPEVFSGLLVLCRDLLLSPPAAIICYSGYFFSVKYAPPAHPADVSPLQQFMHSDSPNFSIVSNELLHTFG